MNKIAIMTSGGDAPGMNPAVHAVTRTAVNLGLEVVGVRYGYSGLLSGDFQVLDNHAVSGMGRRGGTFLQTSRCPEFRRPEMQRQAVDVLRAHGIDGLIVMGGDGSLSGARALHQLGFPVVGLPGTIDNDLSHTDVGIGVDTALNTIMNLVDMIKETASSHERCFIVEVMGRGSGYLAAMATISTQSHVAVVPEFPMNLPRIVEVIQGRFTKRHKNTVIILAEGVCTADELTRQLVAACEGIIPNDIRATVLGHLQRGGAPSHYDRVLASQLGQRAVTALADGESGKMVGKIRGQLVLTDLDTVLGTRPDFRAEIAKLARNLGIEFGGNPG